jgi:hypothetical protein
VSDLLVDCEALAPLLSAFSRGTKRSRLRQLVVVCPKGHTVAEVFPTKAGPHVVWKQMHTWELVAGETVMTRATKWHGAPIEEDSQIIAACRCTEQAAIDGDHLIVWLESGQKRVVYSAS